MEMMSILHLEIRDMIESHYPFLKLKKEKGGGKEGGMQTRQFQWKYFFSATDNSNHTHWLFMYA
jgi:hypothetical protein